MVAAKQHRLPEGETSSRIYRGFDPARSGDVAVVCEQLWLPETLDTTSHGSVYSYDTHVPLLLAGCGIRQVVSDRAVGPHDLAPTLCTLLGIAYPSACEGTVLEEALAH